VGAALPQRRDKPSVKGVEYRPERGDRGSRRQIFTDAGAYRAGHFKLKSGRHGDRYIEKFEVLQWPERV
jgi:hypothetical protein